MFACVGLWNSLFVILYSLLDVSVLMKWCTRNTEEIFAIFIFFAFTVDSLKDVVASKHFHRIFENTRWTHIMVHLYLFPIEMSKFDHQPLTLSYCQSIKIHSSTRWIQCLVFWHSSSSTCLTIVNADLSLSSYNVSDFQNFYPGNGCNSSIIPLQSDTLGASSHISDTFDLMGFPCKPESCILFILLMLGTLWLALKLYNFNQTPYLSTSNRDLLSDYALPIAVIIFSFVGSFLFQVSYW